MYCSPSRFFTIFMIFMSALSSKSSVMLSFIACTRPLAPQLPFVAKTVVVVLSVALLPHQSATPNLELSSTPNLEFSFRVLLTRKHLAFTFLDKPFGFSIEAQSWQHLHPVAAATHQALLSRQCSPRRLQRHAQKNELASSCSR